MQNRCKYLQVKNAVKQQVDEGRFLDSPLPGRREMAEFYSTTTATCNKAVKELISEGVLKTIPGKGTFQHPDYGKSIRSLYVWIPDLQHRFYVKLAEIISSLAAEYHYSRVSITLSRMFSESETDILAGQLSDPQADVLMYSLRNPKSLQLILRHPKRVIVMRFGDIELKGKIDRAQINRIDEEKLSVEHLIKNGHRRIIHISSRAGAPPDITRDGYVQILQKYNIPFNSKLRFLLPEWDFVGHEEHELLIKKCFRRFMRFSDRPTAVFCHNNEIASMFLTMALKNGLRVPEDVSITGCEGKYTSSHGIYQICSAGPELEPTLRVLLERLQNRSRKEFADIAFSMKLIKGNTVCKIDNEL